MHAMASQVGVYTAEDYYSCLDGIAQLFVRIDNSYIILFHYWLLWAVMPTDAAS